MKRKKLIILSKTPLNSAYKIFKDSAIINRSRSLPCNRKADYDIISRLFNFDRNVTYNECIIIRHYTDAQLTHLLLSESNLLVFIPTKKKINRLKIIKDNMDRIIDAIESLDNINTEFLYELLSEKTMPIKLYNESIEVSIESNAFYLLSLLKTHLLNDYWNIALPKIIAERNDFLGI